MGQGLPLIAARAFPDSEIGQPQNIWFRKQARIASCRQGCPEPFILIITDYDQGFFCSFSRMHARTPPMRRSF